jgi:hypothetical protein
MGFPATKREQLLTLKGVGQTVIARLEQTGFSSLIELADEDPAVITKQISHLMGSTCWHNSPQAPAAVAAVVTLAQQHPDRGA